MAIGWEPWGRDGERLVGGCGRVQSDLSLKEGEFIPVYKKESCRERESNEVADVTIRCKRIQSGGGHPGSVSLVKATFNDKNNQRRAVSEEENVGLVTAQSEHKLLYLMVFAARLDSKQCRRVVGGSAASGTAC